MDHKINTNTTNDDWASVAPLTPTTAQMNTFFANPKVAFKGSDNDKVNKIYVQGIAFLFPWTMGWRLTGLNSLALKLCL